MGRPPLQGAPAFRFLPKEITEMERILEEHHGANPPRDTFSVLAEKFSNAPERAGKVGVQWKQIWNWFQNRRHAQRSKSSKAVSKPNQPSSALDDLSTKGTRASTSTTVSGKQEPDNENMDFEARSARDQAWYDVAGFLSYRCLQLDEPEVLVRFAGFGPEEDEWVNVKRSVRRRSLPCEIMECIAVLPGDLILCFQEGKEQALYYDAHILDVQRNRHDIRGCRCRFLVRYDHDKTEEIVPLRKVCRRPETDLRLQSVQEQKLSLPVALPALQEPKLSAPPTTAPLELKDSTLGTDQSDFGHANLAEVSTGIKISSEHGAEVSVPNEASAPNMAQESYLNSAFTPAGEGSNNDRKHDQYDLNSIEKDNSALTTITTESTVPQVADIVRN